MNNWMAVAIIILSLFVGFFVGCAFTYTSMTTMLNTVFSGSNVQMSIDLNETELVQSFGQMMKDDYNLSRDFDSLKNLSVGGYGNN